MIQFLDRIPFYPNWSPLNSVDRASRVEQTESCVKAVRGRKTLSNDEIAIKNKTFFW